MTEDLKLKPYKIHLVHKITAADILERKNFANAFKQLVRQDENFLNKLLMIDEAHFNL